MSGKYENQNPLEKLHPDEPYFFLRAQDMIAPEAVRLYAAILERMDRKEDAAECRAFAKRMDDWQYHNVDKVKLPD